ncbi:exopolysaccharide biosynthesis protein [Sphingomonas sp. Leaf357]|uniref:AAA family ATPase n=1 Tax=Sphingomonas sp. Leaf357 TaxID=1736350 RepID=UPI000700FAD2|nr:AAA family ATPase [Sphingomonas sp. Leaf357]KQS01586.1 exopolysaccharide biosynthesis protein [Sphingomonas sp. Leaf357]
MRKIKPSLLERAAQIYDFEAHLRTRDGAAPIHDEIDAPVVDQPESKAGLLRPRAAGGVAIDRAMLEEQGLLVPGAAIGALAEEFRQVKRQMLITARSVRREDADRSRTILICSANPDEGKTYCAVNLAISMAAERDTEVLLIDADFAKPDVMNRLGVRDSAGLLDALGDQRIDVESCVVRTDIPQLSLLPAGTKTHQDTELLASGRTRELIAALLAADPRRILIFDSPPALAASPASVLAGEVGQVLVVVRADKTGESDLREAVGELDGCEQIQLILNAVSFAPGGRRFGSYYAQDEAK